MQEPAGNRVILRIPLHLFPLPCLDIPPQRDSGYPKFLQPPLSSYNIRYLPISGSRRDVPAAPMFAMEEIAIGQELEGKATANIPAA
jgi:hypothetical protein